ncbi:hypothetical protein [Amycolatopsis alkalitolerans]|uniref:Uncharacterized protein n=1 Tax=Amycolatopsis alkalitolerans TaxID=2547244 RepID=A0A5C4LZZ2_9PSEU|nr:hypothetical protein [Amycolatopsis alkalitolerans]TNC23726.1 hypothetical protein FG385_20395 [Amycolatopsis alkalitolerans]
MTIPPDIFADLGANQQNLLRVIYGPAQEHGRWPHWRHVDSIYSQTGKNTLDVLHSLPTIWPVSSQMPRYGLVRYNDQIIRDDTVIRLTVAAALQLPEFQRVGEDFVHALQVFIDEVSAPSTNPFEVEPITITNEDLGQRIPFSPAFDRLMPDLLWNEPIGLASGSREPITGKWELTLHREGLKQLQGVKDLKDYVERVVAWVQQIPDRVVPSVVPASVAVPVRNSYVDQALIDKLEAAQAGTKWNLKKLLQLLRELNENYASENVYACHALLRAILDHVPPIFGQPNFGSVASQYRPRSSDKKYSENLEKFRLQADDAMHRQVREREDILQFDDLPLRAWVNRLVDEVIAILESDAPSA